MATANLQKGFGLGTYKLVEGSASLASGDTITVDLNTISSVSLTAESSSGDYVIVNFTVSDSVITVLLAGAASGTAPSTLTASVTVHYQVIGE